MAELREGRETEKESRRVLIRLLYCYENPSGARHHVCQPVLPFSGCVSGRLSSFPRSSTTYYSTGVAAVATASGGERRKRANGVSNPTGATPLGNTTSVRMSVWPRLIDPAYYCTPTLLPRPVAFLGSRDSGKRRGRARDAVADFDVWGIRGGLLPACSFVPCIRSCGRAAMQIARERNVAAVWILSRGTFDRTVGSPLCSWNARVPLLMLKD